MNEDSINFFRLVSFYLKFNLIEQCWGGQLEMTRTTMVANTWIQRNLQLWPVGQLDSSGASDN